VVEGLGSGSRAQHLGRDVRQRAALLVLHHRCREAKVGEFDVARRRDETVGGFDVPMEDALRVQVVHAEEGLTDVEGGGGLGDAAALSEHRREVATRHVLESKVDVVRRAEGVEGAHEELGVVLGEDGVLNVDRRHLVGVAQVLLAHSLDGHHVARRLLLGEPDLRKATRRKEPDHGEILDAELARDGVAALERARGGEV